MGLKWCCLQYIVDDQNGSFLINIVLFGYRGAYCHDFPFLRIATHTLHSSDYFHRTRNDRYLLLHIYIYTTMGYVLSAATHIGPEIRITITTFVLTNNTDHIVID